MGTVWTQISLHQDTMQDKWQFPVGVSLATWTLFPVHQHVWDLELMGGVKSDH